MSKKPQDEIARPLDKIVVSHSIDLLKSVVLVLEYQSQPSIANQGQSLDGFSALANYNSLAEKIKGFLNKHHL